MVVEFRRAKDGLDEDGRTLCRFWMRDLRSPLRAENVMTIMIVSFVVAAAVFLNVVATWKAQATGLTRSQKTAQTILAWIIPFFGAIAVIVVSTDPAERQKRAAAVAWATKKTRPDEES